jgi:hypothetical protein
MMTAGAAIAQALAMLQIAMADAAGARPPDGLPISRAE